MKVISNYFLFRNQYFSIQGTKAFVSKIGEYFYDFKEIPNVSILDWSSYEEQAKKRDIILFLLIENNSFDLSYLYIFEFILNIFYF